MDFYPLRVIKLGLLIKNIFQMLLSLQLNYKLWLIILIIC